MTSRELVVKTLNHEATPRVPRDLWATAGDEAARIDELHEINVRYPSDIVTPGGPRRTASDHRASQQGGEHTDAWGCVWHVAGRAPAGTEAFAPGEAARSLPTAAGESSITADSPKRTGFARRPAGLCWRGRRSGRSTACGCWAAARRRLWTSPATPRRSRGLLAMLHEAACKEIELWAKTEVDGVAFRDDWGTAEGLMISPEMWRELFRPLYRDYCKILHARDKFVFFHSDGCILDIFGDLVKVGIDAIHCQLHLMNVGRLAKRYRGRVTFWGGMDRGPLRKSGCRRRVPPRRAGDAAGAGLRQRRRYRPVPVGARRAAANGSRLFRAVARPAGDAQLKM